MVKSEMYIVILENTLSHFKEIEKNGNLPKKFTMTEINKILKEKINTYKTENYEKPTKSKKITTYNIFVAEQMPYLKEKYPEMSGKERMVEVGKLWQIKKANGSDDEVNPKDVKAEIILSDDEKEK